VTDDIAPLITCPPDSLNIMADPGETFATISVIPPVYSDNCSDIANISISWEMTGVTTGTGTGIIPDPYIFNIGTTYITYTVIDECGNETQCDFIVSVLPNDPPEISCPADITQSTDPGLCTAELSPGFPTLISGTEPITYTWEMTGATTASGSGAIAPDPYTFNAGTTTITWIATNIAGADTCDQTIIVTDNEAPTFSLINTAASYCANNILNAIFNPNPTPGIIPEYDDLTVPRPEYYLFSDGDVIFDLDPVLNNFNDNCCADNTLILHWRIDFSPTPNPATVAHELITDPPIGDQTGQPSEYGVIQFPADGVYFNNVVHYLYYWLVDCNGNASAEQMVTITIKPRPDVIKQ
jgi:hypothetical protein